MPFNLLIPVFPVPCTEYYLNVSHFKERVSFWSRLLTYSYFCFVGSMKPLLSLFPNLSFPVGVLSVLLRFSSWAIYLKSVPVVPLITVTQILLMSDYCNISFGPHSPLSPAKANFHCLLSSLFTIYVNSVPPLTSASNSQLFFPVTSGALSTLL